MMRKRDRNKAGHGAPSVVPSMGVRAGAGRETVDEEGIFDLPLFEHNGYCFVSFKSGKQVDCCECLEYVLGMDRLK